jgi:hypothetical protein
MLRWISSKKLMTLFTLNAFILTTALPSECLCTLSSHPFVTEKKFSFREVRQIKRKIKELLRIRKMIKKGTTYREVLGRLEILTQEMNKMFSTKHEYNKVGKQALEELKNSINALQNSSTHSDKIEKTLKPLIQDTQQERHSDVMNDLDQKIDGNAAKMAGCYFIIFIGILLSVLPFKWLRAIGRSLIEIGIDALNLSKFSDVDKKIAALLA